ncbi:thioredoxin reductase [Cryptosporidium andersoni]|uniref:Thioredoxin reductase n=1 Tax=Cryptosporidium andersoni TaxID=117008 RepID=A0A1J4MPC1_9CRYT|nr:thioredoxin reductase [Cryptosporidium andersoni]
MSKTSAVHLSFMYDLIVIGGGSGGLAAAKEAARLGKKVVLFDYVKPSTQGTKWGLGGTCVNVGCVPKKLIHYAANMGTILHHDTSNYGFDVTSTFRWSNLIQTVQNHVKSLNFSYRTGLFSSGVEYINSLANLEDRHTVLFERNGEVMKYTTEHILIAVGGRPNVPENVPGALEYAITSDDIFSLSKSPGKTLIVGASYIGLETAGFLTELGFEAIVAVRSIPLRGFDRQCSEKVVSMMKEYGTKFLEGVVPINIEKIDDKLKVVFSNAYTEQFDTVIYATGRYPDTKYLKLNEIGVYLTPNNKIIAPNDTTNIPNIHAIGDVVDGRPELTPVAIKAGILLARRLFGDSKEFIDYKYIPTTIFTPTEYGSIGYSSEAAIAEYGEDDIEEYLFEFTTLEIAASHRYKVESSRIDSGDFYMSPNSFAKLITVKSLDNKVVGFHFVGLNAGEITQGFSLAIKLGAKKSDFDSMIGIHPTDAEVFSDLSITRRSGESFIATGGCGGGKCG